MNDPAVTRTQTGAFAEGSTAPAGAASTPTGETPADQPEAFHPGDRVGDFVILRQLGRGSFARVFLALEVPLNRRVALKVSERPAPAEAVTLAGLEHDHIVKVFTQFRDPASLKHCLALQYVPGTTLADVIRKAYEAPDGPRTGADLLAAVDALSAGETDFDPAAAQDRAELARLPFPEAVCRLGERLAAALAYAHARGVLHCDVKPANILVNRYGRPMLADFNVSVDRNAPSGGLGGTVEYMAPEHLAYFANAGGSGPGVDHRADLYSLGVVLYELATGRPAFPRSGPVGPLDVVGWIGGRDRFPDPAGLPPPLERVLRRLLSPDPPDRYADGMELAAALASAGRMLAAGRRLPPPGPVTRFAARRPFVALLVAAFLPQLIGSALQITYNGAEIVLTWEQREAFEELVVYYNAAVYPLGLYLVYCAVRPVYRGWRALDTGEGLPADELDRVRGEALRQGDWANAVASVGWLPGAVVFPVGLDLLAGPVPAAVYAHFAASFALAWLVAMVYSHLGIQLVVLRVLYPRLGNPDRAGEGATTELARSARWLDPFQFLAALVPLAGAVLLVATAEERLTVGVRLLVAGLIVLGMAGVGIAVVVRARLRRTVDVLSGRTTEPGPC